MPKYSIDAPDGKTYQIDGPDGANDEQVRAEVLKQHPLAGQPPLPSEPSTRGHVPTEHTIGQQVTAGAKDLANAGVRQLSKGAISAAAFIPDMAASIYNAGERMLPDEARKFLGGDSQSPSGGDVQLPSSFFNRLLDQHTTPPSTTAGKAGEEIGSAIVGGAATLERKGAQALERGMRMAQDFKPLTRVTTKAAEDAHVAGYNLSPSYIGGPVRRTVQTIAGGPKVDAEISKGNERVTDNLAKLALGLHPQEELTPETLKALKEASYGAYEDVRQLGVLPEDPEFIAAVKAAGGRFAQRGKSYGDSYRYESIGKEKQPYLDSGAADAGETLDEIRALRHAAQQNLRRANPEENALGQTQREIANAMEDRIEHAATAAQKPELIYKLKEARRQLAMIHAVEDSMGAGGHIRADDLKKLMDAGVPLTGPLRTIAVTAKNFPKSVQHVAPKGETGEFSAIDYLLGGTGLVAGHPALSTLAIARPISRWSLQTEKAQKSMVDALRKPPAGPVKKAIGKSATGIGKVGAAASRSAVRGGAMMGTEALAEGQDEQ